jgi:hypothetical protein
MARGRLARTISLTAFASAGVLTGHLLDYLSVFPNGTQRIAALLASGHSYFRHAVLVTASLALIVAGFAFLFGVSSERRGRSVSLKALTGAIATIQSIGFVALEIGERLVSGSAFARDLIPILGIGLVLQVAVAFLGALLLIGIERAGQTLSRTLSNRRANEKSRSQRVAATNSIYRIRPITGYFYGPRAPPALFAALI